MPSSAYSQPSRSRWTAQLQFRGHPVVFQQAAQVQLQGRPGCDLSCSGLPQLSVAWAAPRLPANPSPFINRVWGRLQYFCRHDIKDVKGKVTKVLVGKEAATVMLATLKKKPDLSLKDLECVSIHGYLFGEADQAALHELQAVAWSKAGGVGAKPLQDLPASSSAASGSGQPAPRNR